MYLIIGFIIFLVFSINFSFSDIFLNKKVKLDKIFYFRERPTMALVLWEPPSRHLRFMPAQPDVPTTDSLEDDNNNNSSNINIGDNSSNNNIESVVDLNQTMDNNVNDPLLEPMDL